MITYVKIGENKYPATIDGVLQNRSWDNRESKAITLTAAYSEAAVIFTDGIAWSIVREYASTDDSGATSTVTDEYDNSAYSVLGDIVVHTDGTCTVNIGKPTDLEDVLEQLYGGES